LHLEGGTSVKINSGLNNTIQLSAEYIPVCNDIKKSIDNHKFDLYDYENEINDVSIETISKLFEIARLNREAILLKNKILIEQDIQFFLYKDLKLNNDMTRIFDNPIFEFKLNSNLKKSKGYLIIHIDFRSFYLCLIRKKVWNGTIGALCLFDREPNVFYPSVTFSLNYLVISDSQKMDFKIN
jgi:hypothetical protein